MHRKPKETPIFALSSLRDMHLVLDDDDTFSGLDGNINVYPHPIEPDDLDDLENGVLPSPSFKVSIVDLLNEAIEAKLPCTADLRELLKATNYGRR
jgi:hypothetical protein